MENQLFLLNHLYLLFFTFIILIKKLHQLNNYFKIKFQKILILIC